MNGRNPDMLAVDADRAWKAVLTHDRRCEWDV